MDIAPFSARKDHSILSPDFSPNCSTIHIGTVVLTELLPPVDTRDVVEPPRAMLLPHRVQSKRSLMRSIVYHIHKSLLYIPSYSRCHEVSLRWYCLLYTSDAADE